MPPIYTVELVLHRRGRRRKLETAADVASILSRYLDRCDREHFVVIMVDAASNIIGINTVAIGTLLSAQVTGREVFKPAILANAASIVLAHNHPSGEVQPSASDIALTAKLSACGDALDIHVLDHIIVGDCGRFTSLKRNGYL
jgi:DNA repair protein RadC